MSTWAMRLFLRRSGVVGTMGLTTTIITLTMGQEDLPAVVEDIMATTMPMDISSSRRVPSEEDVVAGTAMAVCGEAEAPQTARLLPTSPRRASSRRLK